MKANGTVHQSQRECIHITRGAFPVGHCPGDFKSSPMGVPRGVSSRFARQGGACGAAGSFLALPPRAPKPKGCPEKKSSRGLVATTSPQNALIVPAPPRPQNALIVPSTAENYLLQKYASPTFAEVLVLQLPGELPCRCRERPAGAEAHRGVSHRTKPQAKPPAQPPAQPALHSDGQIDVYCHLTYIIWKNESFRNPIFRTCCDKKFFFCFTAPPSILTSILTSTVTSI